MRLLEVEETWEWATRGGGDLGTRLGDNIL